MMGNPFAILQEEQTAGTQGLSSGSGTTVVCPINTISTSNITGLGLADDVITLPAGTYYMFARNSNYKTQVHKIWLENLTDAETTLHGMPGFNDNALGGDGTHVQGIFTIAAEKTFSIKGYTSDPETGGWGRSSGLSQTEVYHTMYIEKLA